MSTIDQAFVNAFARRSRTSNRPTQAAQASAPVANQASLQTRVAANTGQLVRVDTPVTNAPQPHVMQPQVKQPHAAPNHAANNHAAPNHAADSTPNNTPVDHLAQQHLHTAYVFAEPQQDTAPEHEVTSRATPTSIPTPEPRQARNFSAVPEAFAEQRVDAPAIPEPELNLHAEPTAEAIQPIWEVDSFDIPQSVEQLFFEEKLFELVAKRIQDAVNDGLKSVMVTSSKSGEGRSTVAIGMAMAAAATGLRVALIDGDTQDPTLADDMRLDVDYGWLDTLRGGLPLSQIAVLSIEDGLTLIPLMPPQHEQVGATADEIETLVSVLGDQYDLVVIDSPAGDQSQMEAFAKLVDSAIIARDASRTDINTVNELSYRLHAAGAQGVGIVENFS